MTVFFLMFAFVFGMVIFVFAKSIIQWNKNNNSPRLSVDAAIVDKQRKTHHHNHNGHHHVSHSYYVTFRVQSGDTMALRVPRDDFYMLMEGDKGVLSFQGTRYLGFESK